MRSLKKMFSVVVLTLGLIAFMGGSSLLMAGGADIPHVTHRTHDRGPHLGDDCARCHTGDPEKWHNVDWDACNTCHSPGGAYDGVNDLELGAKNNWANTGSAEIASLSLIYEGDGTLKAGKQKWCATCHDQSKTGTILIDDFEEYCGPHIPPEEGTANLQKKWKAGKDARKPTLQEPGVRGADMLEGWAMRVGIVWERNLNQNYGVVQRDFSEPLGLSGKDFFNFYLKVQKVNRIKNVRVKVRKASTGTYCTAKIDVDSVNGFKNNAWKFVSLPRESFDDQTCFDEPNDVDRIRFHIFEKYPFTQPTWECYVYFDEIGCDTTGPYVGANVVGDDVTSGYYVTGHRMPCTHCHDPGSEHIDGDRRPILDYIKYTDNPTNFRFYNDPTKQMQLPYTEYDPGPEGAFALCYRCHDEEAITTSAISYDCLGDPDLKTNFREDDYCVAGAWEHNLHYYHVVNEQTVGPLFFATCVLCHDPHGQSNPAMTRQEMGNCIYFDTDGCEIVDRDIDRNSNDTPDWYDPDFNEGLAQTTVDYEPLCRTCHSRLDYDLHLPDPDCADGQHNEYAVGDNVAGYYKREYKILPHTTGGMEVGPDCFTAECHASQSHATHFDSQGKGPGIPFNQTGCDICHLVDETSVYEIDDMVTEGVCDTCHSPDGAFDGVNNANIGAKANWADGVYEEDGTTLQSGKEKWCATCHDDVPASSRPGPGIEVVVDTLGAGLVCDWTYKSGVSGAYNGDHYHHAAGSGSCTATWTPTLPAAETYNVYAWWKAGASRATDAKYTIYYDGGSETVEVNQEINGDQWNLLGTYPFTAGTSGYVVLSDDANENVIADAIKLDNGSLEVSIYAPNVIGDNIDYGFYVTGHKINCLLCHDASKKHIDNEHRTYEVDDSTYAAINPYGDSYRLQVASNKPTSTLCFVCHNSYEVLGQNSSDVSHTNFWNDDNNIENSHWLHVVGFTGIHFDSDWDGEIDSTESCITCHNVHGSPTSVMIRHGELISSYGTTDKVPALNFAYLVAPTEFDTATWTPDLAADTYSVYAWWKAGANRATNATYTIYYDGGSETVEVNQQIDGDQWNLLGTYPFAAGTSGYVELTDEGADGYVIADAVGWDTDGGTPDIIIDDGDPEFDTVGDWTCPSGSGGYGDDHCYAKVVPEPDPDATLPDSVGGRMSFAGPGVGQNGVCWACHGGISYERAPYLGPKVIMGQVEPDTVANDGTGTSLITVFISDPDGDVSSVEIDLTPIGGSANQPMNDDGAGYYSYQVTIPVDTPDSPLTFVITVTDVAANTGEGEARLIVINPDSIYVDTLNAQFVCDWTCKFSSGAYNDDHSFHAAGTGSCTATWTPDLGAADTYNVYAWWKASSNRATDAKYTIYYDGGSQTIDVNQEINGSQWNLLGTYPFVAGTSGYVVLSDDANQYVIADAIKFEP